MQGPFEWVAGDTLKKLVWTFYNPDRTLFDLTGYTVKLQGRCADGDQGTTFNIAAPIVGSPTLGYVEVVPGPSLTIPAGRADAVYTCEWEFTKTAGGQKHYPGDRLSITARAPVMA